MRFIRLYHPDCDQHENVPNLPKMIRRQAADVERGCHALIVDLEQRDLLDDTPVVYRHQGRDYRFTDVHSEVMRVRLNYALSDIM